MLSQTSQASKNVRNVPSHASQTCKNSRNVPSQASQTCKNSRNVPSQASQTCKNSRSVHSQPAKNREIYFLKPPKLAKIKKPKRAKNAPTEAQSQKNEFPVFKSLVLSPFCEPDFFQKLSFPNSDLAKFDSSYFGGQNSKGSTPVSATRPAIVHDRMIRRPRKG